MEKIKEAISMQRSKKCKKEVWKHIVKRSPNHIRLHTLEQSLYSFSLEEILSAIDSLEKENKIITTEFENRLVPDRVITRYKASEDYSDLCEEVISIGGVEFPRVLDGDPGDPEQLNVFVEALASYDSKIESRISNLTSELTRKYWANLATLFGLFVAIFALILKATDPIIINKDVSHWDVFLYKTVSLFPLAIILLLFVVLLRFTLRKF